MNSQWNCIFSFVNNYKFLFNQLKEFFLSKSFAICFTSLKYEIKSDVSSNTCMRICWFTFLTVYDNCPKGTSQEQMCC